jgi:hypothetical protein
MFWHIEPILGKQCGRDLSKQHALSLGLETAAGHLRIATEGHNRNV